MSKSVRALALVAGVSLFALAGAARAADHDGPEAAVEAPVDAGVIDGAADNVGDGKGGIADGVVLSRGGDDGVIEPTERTLPGVDEVPALPDTVENPVMYTMAGGIADSLVTWPMATRPP